MPLLKTTSSSFPPPLAGTRDACISPQIHCRWEQEVGGNITSLEKPSPTKLSVVPSLRRHIDCDLEDSFEDILQQKGGPWELRKGVISMYCPKVSLYGQEFKDINV
ncbi:hypothetical protein ACHAQE_002388 [Botrytis cinerea]|uniref:Uncharacterized protein n=1 Tax=Botryotinia fuckeliana (strain T4) TaxID=999810 RepID=G2YQI6_BOTF4|nr:hypothetical protein BofuT4_P130640.1 [Botrytis cinerea T4]